MKSAIKANQIVMFWNNDYGLFFLYVCLFLLSKSGMKTILSFYENQFQIIRINGEKKIEKLEITEILSLLNHLSHFTKIFICFFPYFSTCSQTLMQWSRSQLVTNSSFPYNFIAFKAQNFSSSNTPSVNFSLVNEVGAMKKCRTNDRHRLEKKRIIENGKENWRLYDLLTN